MKIRLIVPDISDKVETQVDYVYLGRIFCASTPKGRAHKKKTRQEYERKLPLMPLALPTLAALTPPEHDVAILDENIEDIDYNDTVDIVGITFMSFAAKRAYKIADAFRENGTYVALGGVHVTTHPEEAMPHADTIFVGEAEDTWPLFLHDFQNNRPQKKYVCPAKPNLKKLVIPRWDLVKKKHYLTPLVQVARGCNNKCDFCSVRSLFGPSRYKPVENVVAEIEAAIQGSRFPRLRRVSFADDNITADKEYAKKLFRSMIPLNLHWSSQASIDIAEDDELLDLAQKSGCEAVYIGFESILQDNLNTINKGKLNNVELFKGAIEKIHSYGIHIYAFIIFGLDSDDESVFARTVEFITETGIAFPIISLIAPAPKTRFGKRMKEQGRILSEKWEDYDGSHVLIEPRNMSPETLINGFRWSLKQLYSPEAFLDRMDKLWKTGSLKHEKNFTIVKLYLMLLLTIECFRQTGEIKAFLKKMRKVIWLHKGLKLDFINFALSFVVYVSRLPEPEIKEVAPASINCHTM